MFLLHAPNKKKVYLCLCIIRDRFGNKKQILVVSLVASMRNVMVDIAVKNCIEGSQKSHEAVSVDSSHFHGGCGDHIGGTRLALQEGSLSEVVTRQVVFDFLGCGAGLKRLSSDCISADDDEEIISLVALGDDLRSGLEGVLFDSVCNLAPLVMVHALKNGDGRQEIFVPIPHVLCSVFHDVVEGVAIQLPESNIGLGHDGSGSWSIVE
jgi:hypothetical protein